MGLFHLLWACIVGFFAGLIARHLVGAGHMGILMTTLLGIVGSVVGGFIAGLIWPPRDARFHPAGFVFSILGAMLLLWIGHLMHL
jgi:uncharacterized membrane protein YeaQ/YmgE (transglycosylase-associated protein family)